MAKGITRKRDQKVQGQGKGGYQEGERGQYRGSQRR